MWLVALCRDSLEQNGGPTEQASQSSGRVFFWGHSGFLRVHQNRSESNSDRSYDQIDNTIVTDARFNRRSVRLIINLIVDSSNKSYAVL